MTAVGPITVVCLPDGPGWSCTVKVGSGGRTTEHHVSVSKAELDRFAPAATGPTSLVERSFRFLLEREPPESILSRFSIGEIERYFPDYPEVIRLSAG